jgi:hypothetical protein
MLGLPHYTLTHFNISVWQKNVHEPGDLRRHFAEVRFVIK